MQILSSFRRALERFAEGATETSAGVARRRLSWGSAASLLGVALSVFTVSALAYYHVIVGGERAPNGVFQGAVVSLYRFLGFVPSFFLALLVLVWCSLRFVTGAVQGLLVRCVAILLFCLSLSILVALAQDLAPQAGGLVGSFFGARVLRLVGSASVALVLMALLVMASLLLSTDWFFFRYFQGLLAAGTPGAVAGGAAAPALLVGAPSLGGPGAMRGPRPAGEPIGEPQPMQRPVELPRSRAEVRVIDLTIRSTDSSSAAAAEAAPDAEASVLSRARFELPADLEGDDRALGDADRETDQVPESLSPPAEPSDSTSPAPAVDPLASEDPMATPTGDGGSAATAPQGWESDRFSRPESTREVPAPAPDADPTDAPERAGARDATDLGAVVPRARRRSRAAAPDATPMAPPPEPTESQPTTDGDSSADASSLTASAEERPELADGQDHDTAEDGAGESAPRRQETLFADHAPTVDLLQEAAELVIKTHRASVAFLQRRLRIRFAEASALLERLEHLGVIGPYQEGSHRAVLMSLEDWRAR